MRVTATTTLSKAGVPMMQRSAAARVRQTARRAARTGTRFGGVTSPRTTTAAKARRMSPRQARTFPGALSRDTSLHVCAAAARIPGSARAERPAPSAPSLRPLRRSRPPARSGQTALVSRAREFSPRQAVHHVPRSVLVGGGAVGSPRRTGRWFESAARSLPSCLQLERARVPTRSS